MNKRRKSYKRRTFKTKEDTNNAIFRQVEKDVQKANQRLKSLERHVKNGSWSSKKLMNRLSAETTRAWNRESGRIKINKNMTVTQLKNVQKSIQKFMNSTTSTYAGIKSVSKATKESLYETFNTLDSNITKEDIEDIYESMVGDDFKDLSEKVGSSELIALMVDSIDYKLIEESFIEHLSSILDLSNDIDLQNKARRLYNKFSRYKPL